jgi:DNA-directed RNA polymerase, mitochondrial
LLTGITTASCKEGDGGAKRAASPNFVHSQDATHLIMVVNEAIEEGIDILVVHDSFSCLATDAIRVNGIIREKMRWMYECWDPLARLYDMNASDKIKLPVPPPQGDLAMAEVVKSEYPFC